MRWAYPLGRGRTAGKGSGGIGLTIAILALLASVLTVPGRATATPIAGAITSITTTATHTSQYDTVDFGCQWAIPDGSSAGDTFTLQLPPQLKWWGAAQFPLTSPDGLAVAHANVTADGLVTFTLTDYVATHPVAVHGTCSFTTLYTAATGGGHVSLSFTVGSAVIRVPVDTEGPCTGSCTPPRTSARKDMWWVTADQNGTQSVIRAPGTTAQRNTITITDTPHPGLALDCSSLEAVIGRHLTAGGYLTDPTDTSTYPAQVTCSAGAATATWTGVPAGEFAELWIAAAVTDPSMGTYTNAGDVAVNGADSPVASRAVRTDANGTGSGTPPTPAPTTTTPAPTTTTPTTPAPTTTTSTTAPPATTPPIRTTTATGSGTVTLPARHTSGRTGPATVTPAGTLAFTGTNAIPIAAIAAGMTGVGAMLLLESRRKRRPQRH